jgi:chromate transporter
MHSGPFRWYAFDPHALDSHVAVLAVTAAILTFRFHRSLIEVIVVMAGLGIVTQLPYH